MTTLSVQEAMGLKVDREAVATFVLPQLWAMSMGPCKLTAHLTTEGHVNVNTQSTKHRTIPTLHERHSETRGTG
jgi:hypothetical protein